MEKEYTKFLEYIENSKKILILSHKGADLDAFCSSLIVKNFLNTYYPDKEVSFTTRDNPNTNIPFMKEINIVEKIEDDGSDTIIVCDTSNINYVLRDDDTLDVDGKKVLIIDHHVTESDGCDFRINESLSSATEQAIYLFKYVLGDRYVITKEISELGQVGIIADTKRLLYETTKPSTFRLMAELREVYSLDLEEIEYKTSKFPAETLKPYEILLRNLKIVDDMAYTYITREESLENNCTNLGINSAQREVKDQILRYIQGVHWGFVMTPSGKDEKEWHIGFRSTKGYQEVNKITEDMGGGGHLYASAAHIHADTFEDALNIVKETIKKNTSISF